MSPPVIIIGAGGHAAVVADALLCSGGEVLGFTDADRTLHGRLICGLPVLGDDGELGRHSAKDLRLVNGLGGTRGERLRREVQDRLQSRGWTFDGVRHPSAVVSSYAQIGPGVHLMAACVVQAGARIAAGCIVNTGAIIEHDADIGDFTHVAPGAVVCGNARVGENSHIGAGAVVRQGLQLGPGNIVGAGAVVVTDHPEPGTLVGVPARPRQGSR